MPAAALKFFLRGPLLSLKIQFIATAPLAPPEPPVKITSINNKVVDAVSTSRSGAGNSSAPSTTTGGRGAVDLSPTARHLSSLQGADGDINVERVNEIRAAIASGQLKVDPSRIADSLLASVRELLK